MPIDPELRTTRAQYLALEATASSRHEYLQGEVREVPAGPPEHDAVRAALSSAVQGALRAARKRCLVLSANMRVRVDEADFYAWPDVTVVCAKPQVGRDEDPHSLLNPLVVFEVVSAATEAWDRGAKAHAWRRAPSLQEYVLVPATRGPVELLRRAEHGWWRSAVFAGSSALPLASLGVEVPLDAVFAPPEAR